MKIVRLMCLALLLLLTSCSLLSQTPPTRAIELAITQQLTQTQKALAQDLGIWSQQNPENSLKPNFKINSLTVQHRNKLTDLNQLRRPGLSQVVNEVYRVSGKFDATWTTNNLQRHQKNSSFEVLLGREVTDTDSSTNSVETWYLLE